MVQTPIAPLHATFVYADEVKQTDAESDIGQDAIGVFGIDGTFDWFHGFRGVGGKGGWRDANGVMNERKVEHDALGGAGKVKGREPRWEPIWSQLDR